MAVNMEALICGVMEARGGHGGLYDVWTTLLAYQGVNRLPTFDSAHNSAVVWASPDC